MENVKIKFNNAAMKELEAKAELFIATVAENVKVEAKILVPVDTGKLQESIDVFDGDNKREYLIGSKTTTYALYVELGTVKMPPKPYMRPALDNVIASLD